MPLLQSHFAKDYYGFVEMTQYYCSNDKCHMHRIMQFKQANIVKPCCDVCGRRLRIRKRKSHHGYYARYKKAKGDW